MAIGSQANSIADRDGHTADLRITTIWEGPSLLGESPLWDARRQRLFWIDSLWQRIWSADAEGGMVQSWELPDLIGSIGLCDDGRFIAGLGRGFALISLEDDAPSIDWIADPDPTQPDTRLNDGKVDRHGRYWCGTMNMNFNKSNAALYLLHPDRHWELVDNGFTVSNGIAFSPDGTHLYFSDSRVDRSYRYDLDPVTGLPGQRHVFLDTTAYEGRVDGATVDSDGRYWAALFRGSAVGCFAPDGQMLRRIELPFSCPTMCTFGGPDLDILYVTSATFPLSAEEKTSEPRAGALLSIEGLGVRGLEEPRFNTGAEKQEPAQTGTP